MLTREGIAPEELMSLMPLNLLLPSDEEPASEEQIERGHFVEMTCGDKE